MWIQCFVLAILVSVTGQVLCQEQNTPSPPPPAPALGSQVFATALPLDFVTESYDEQLSPNLEPGSVSSQVLVEDEEYFQGDNTYDQDLAAYTSPSSQSLSNTAKTRKFEAVDFQEINSQCGYQNIDPECQGIRDEIFGGELTTPTRFPYMVSLQIQKEDNGACFVHFCGGTIIAPDVVLTAAHCVQEISPTNRLEGTTVFDVFVALAPTCRHLESAIKGVPDRVKVKYYKMHPDYSRRTLENDIALLFLEKELSPNGPFARYKTQSPVTDNNQATMSAISLSGILETNRDTLSVIGYGDTNVNEAVHKEYNVRYMRRARLDYVPDYRCDQMLDATSAIRELIPEKMLCAYNVSADACGGDSGGPLVITGVGQGLSEVETYEFDYQIGIVSWGPGEACSTLSQQFIGVYTELGGYIEWIDNSIQQFRSVGIGSFQIDTSFSSPSETGDCRTKNGCSCKQLWQYQGQSYNECANPDSDDGGNWCMVDLNECYRRPSGSVSLTGEFWDRCECPQQTKVKQDGCPATRLGCSCRPQWSHSGISYQGCDNPDADPTGDWCYIQGDFNQCDNGGGVNVASRTITSESTGEIIGYFDYCKQQCYN
eukprot:TRINITY_DN20931_c0_g1_i2.p1 TRINITY_DN20931_c0_g1~~TRINITY_DN20931_c0_g1_i2.p1  ORF type:complete len:599 (+),score=98.56 TRINITY_DN20931_c0_g1_i2:93-1889(+)